MKKYLFVLALFASSAYAAIGYLQNCEVGSGPGGGPALIGTYSVNGQLVKMYFALTPPNGPSTCPTQINIP
jgi:hypothetical protein